MTSCQLIHIDIQLLLRTIDLLYIYIYLVCWQCNLVSVHARVGVTWLEMEESGRREGQLAAGSTGLDPLYMFFCSFCLLLALCGQLDSID